MEEFTCSDCGTTLKQPSTSGYEAGWTAENERMDLGARDFQHFECPGCSAVWVLDFDDVLRKRLPDR